jgi:spore coat protein A
MQRPQSPSEPLLDIRSLPKFVDPLPIPERAKPVGVRPQRGNPKHKIPHYRIAMRPFEAQIHRDVKPTTFWGYDGSCPGPTFDVRSGEGLTVEWVNELPQQHLFPIDHSLHGAEADKPPVRTVVHLHGGRVGPESDGYPENWYASGQSATHYYPNRQDATTLFYHDHAMGITRLNTVAGLTGLYIIRDEHEDALNLPHGRYEVPLIIFDRSFRQNGRIYYPTSGEPERPWVSEYYGGGILVNGKLFPFLDVEPRKYRFRVVNGSNGSFYVLSLAPDPSFTSPSQTFYQIGTDQGLLPAPAKLDQLIVGPGERADMVIDFARWPNQQLYLRTSAATILQFRVSSNRQTEDSPDLPAVLRPLQRIPETTAVRTRELTINDCQDRLGRSKMMLLNNMHWSMPITEKPVLNSTEIWSFINLTDDSHPIHLHLVRFQILDRRPFDLPTYQLTGKVVFTGPAQPLAAHELGWKDTVRVDPLSVTRIITKFEGFTGRYVWHCHVLEHEDNEMMRPYEIVPA